MNSRNRPISVLMAVPQYPFPVVGGLEKQARELARELARQGLRVRVLSGRVRPDQPDTEEIDGVVIHRLPWPRSRMVRWVMMPLLVWRLFTRVKHEIDVVHSHVFSGFGLYLILLAKCAGVPIMVKLSSVGHGGLPGLTRGLLGRLRGAMLRRADAIVALSQQSLEELEQFGFDRMRVLATPNGIRVQSACVQRQALGVSCRMVFVGRLHRDKGLQDLVCALRLVDERCLHEKWSLDIIGDGDQRRALEQWIREAGLADKIQLLGHQDGIADLLTHYDALLLPSYREGNSNVILEAMAAGLAVISTNAGGTPMLLGPSGRDWIHQPGDIDALASLVVRLLAEPERAEALGRELRRRVEDHFEIGVVARTYVAAYRKLIDGGQLELASLSNPVVTESAPAAQPNRTGRH